jgi:hypothetical protein
MSYSDREYKKGLSGQKPGLIDNLFDDDGSRAKRAGYRQHLANADLVYQMRESARSNEKWDGSYYKDERPDDGSFHKLWGTIFLCCATFLAIVIICVFADPTTPPQGFLYWAVWICGDIALFWWGLNLRRTGHIIRRALDSKK